MILITPIRTKTVRQSGNKCEASKHQSIELVVCTFYWILFKACCKSYHRKIISTFIKFTRNNEEVKKNLPDNLSRQSEQVLTVGDEKVYKKCEIVETESYKRTRRSFLKSIILRARQSHCQKPEPSQMFVIQNMQYRKQCLG